MARNYNMDGVKKELESSKGMFTGVEFWRPPEGESIIRMLPPLYPLPGGLPYFRYYNHYLEGDDYGAVRCRKTLGLEEPCPICDYVARMSEDPKMKTLIANIAPSTRYAVDIIVRGEEPPTVKIWTFGPRICADLNGYFADEEYIIRERGEEYDILDIEKGRDFKIVRTGTGLNTKYQVFPRPTVSPVLPDPVKTAELLKMRHNLPELFKVLSVEDLAASFFAWLQGQGVDEDTEMVDG